MSTYHQVISVDPFYISHAPLIKGSGIYGIVGTRSRHYAHLGTTILISADRIFTQKWHEAAHGYITYWTPLGETILTLSNILHVLFLEINTNTEKQAGEIIEIFKRIRQLRERLVRVFLLSHEIFAISTEMIADACTIPNKKSTLIANGENKFHTSLNTLITKQGFEIHKHALKIINKFTKVYGDFFYCKCAAYQLLNNAPYLITNSEPSDILFGNIQNINALVPEIDLIYDFLIENYPSHHYFDKIHFLNDKIKLAFTKFDFCLKSEHALKHFKEWINEWDRLLPLKRYNKLYKKHKEGIREFQIYKELKSKKLTTTKDRTETITGDTYDIIADTDVLWRKISNEDRVFLDIPILPPPLTLSKEDDVLKLYLRSDINNPFGLFYIGDITTKMVMIENIVENMLTPILCFFYHSLKKEKGCRHGPEKCEVALEIKDLITRFESKNHEAFRPLLLCCRDDFVYIVEFKGIKRNTEVTGKISFKFIVFEPKLLHKNLTKEVDKSMKKFEG